MAVRKGRFDYNIWAAYQDCFRNVTKATFTTLRTGQREPLRKCLPQRGVFVAKRNEKSSFADVLFALLQEEERHEQSDGKLKKRFKKLKTSIRIMELRDRLNPTRTAFAIKNPYRRFWESTFRRSSPATYPSLPSDLDLQHLYEFPVARKRLQVSTRSLPLLYKPLQRVAFEPKRDKDEEAWHCKQPDYYLWPDTTRNISMKSKTSFHHPAKTFKPPFLPYSQRDAKEQWDSRDQRSPKALPVGTKGRNTTTCATRHHHIRELVGYE